VANDYVHFYLDSSFRHLDSNICAFACGGHTYSYISRLGDCSISGKFKRWRRLDNRCTDLFGSTYEVPLGEYKQHTEPIRVLISGDKFLQCSFVVYLGHNILYDNFMANNHDLNCHVHDFDTLDSLLLQAYPNASIDLIGDFNETSLFEADLVQLLDYLNSKLVSGDELPTHIIFRGLETTYNRFGYDRTAEIYQSILDICSNNAIKIVCVLCGPNYDDGYSPISGAKFKRPTYEEIFTLEFIKLVNMLSNSYVVNLYAWLKKRSEIYSLGWNVVLDTKDNLPSFNETNSWGVQMDLAYNYIYDNCFKKLGLEVFREKYYVSIVNMRINAPNTMNTITGSVHTTDLYFKSTYPMPPPHDPPIIPHYFTKYGGSEFKLNTFKNSGEFVAVVVHTEYNDALFASEQFQANCNNEFVAQNDKYAEGGVLQNLLKIRYWTTGYIIGEQGYYPVPVYPTAGAPWLTISDRNVTDYGELDEYNTNHTRIGVWLTRDDSSMTITVNLRSVSDDKPSLYQNIVFGCLDIKPVNHVHNLYCGGGSGGLCQDIYVHPNIRTGTLQYTAGNVYDLDMDNLAMSNSNILHTTKFNQSTASNFRVLASEGIWKNIFMHKQDASVVNYPTLGYPVDWAYVLNDVIDYYGEHNIYPRMSNDCKRLGSKYINNNGYVNVVGKNELVNEYKLSDYMQRIRVNLNPNMPHNEYRSTGAIPHCFVCWDDEIPAGEIEISGKKYLSIPCGWDGRLYNYGPKHIGIVNDVWGTETVVDDWEERVTLRKENVIRDKLLIELG